MKKAKRFFSYLIFALPLVGYLAVSCSGKHSQEGDSTVQNADGAQYDQSATNMDASQGENSVASADGAYRQCPPSTRYNAITHACEGHQRPNYAPAPVTSQSSFTPVVTDEGWQCSNTGKKLLGGVPNCAAIPGYIPPMGNPIQGPANCCLWPDISQFRSCIIANFPNIPQESIPSVYVDHCLNR
jgi:hypothetical protein